MVRGYEHADLEACRELWVELTDWHRRIYRSLDIGGADPGRLFDQHLDRVGPENIWVAEAAGRVVGMVGVIPGEGEYELEPIVVTAAHRGHGIGRRLAEAVIERAREGGVRFLKVRPTARNELALSFFRAVGFDILGHIELLIDFRPLEHHNWRSGEPLAGRDFRV